MAAQTFCRLRMKYTTTICDMQNRDRSAYRRE